MAKYRIRFNTQYPDGAPWRIVDQDGREELVHEVSIKVPSLTTQDWMPELNCYKWHITCEGFLLLNWWEVKGELRALGTIVELPDLVKPSP